MALFSNQMLDLQVCFLVVSGVSIVKNVFKIFKENVFINLYRILIYARVLKTSLKELNHASILSLISFEVTPTNTTQTYKTKKPTNI